MQIEGRNPVFEALKSNRKIKSLLIQNILPKSDKIEAILKLAKKRGVRIIKTGKHKLLKISQTGMHQGVILFAEQVFTNLEGTLKQLQDENKKPFFVILHEVLYQQNLGAIIRSAECAGVNAVIVSSKTKFTPDAVRASMGATEHMPIVREGLFNSIRILKDNDIKIFGIETSTDKLIYDEDLTVPCAFVIGGEDSGITKSLLDKCDSVLKIPMFGKINSLNMSNAAAVALFEKVRQELFNKRKSK